MTLPLYLVASLFEAESFNPNYVGDRERREVDCFGNDGSRKERSRLFHGIDGNRFEKRESPSSKRKNRSKDSPAENGDKSRSPARAVLARGQKKSYKTLRSSCVTPAKTTDKRRRKTEGQFQREAFVVKSDVRERDSGGFG